jgi:hypothetical protein
MDEYYTVPSLALEKIIDIRLEGKSTGNIEAKIPK